MQAIEFKAPIRNGAISIPPQYDPAEFPESVRVIILSETSRTTSRATPDASAQARRREAFRRLDGCLAGMDMTRNDIKSERLARQ